MRLLLLVQRFGSNAGRGGDGQHAITSSSNKPHKRRRAGGDGRHAQQADSRQLCPLSLPLHEVLVDVIGLAAHPISCWLYGLHHCGVLCPTCFASPPCVFFICSPLLVKSRPAPCA